MNNVKIGDAGAVATATPFSKRYMEELKKVEDYRVQGYLRLIESVNREIDDVSRIIAQKAMASDDTKLLMTIPGISFFSALLISSEIGEIQRFQDSSSLVAYAGLAPSTHSSGGKTYHGTITKQGSPYLRWILNQCVHMRTEPDGSVASFYDRLATKKGNSKAVVAASSKLLKIVYWVLKEKRPYHG